MLHSLNDEDPLQRLVSFTQKNGIRSGLGAVFSTPFLSSCAGAGRWSGQVLVELERIRVGGIPGSRVFIVYGGLRAKTRLTMTLEKE